MHKFSIKSQNSCPIHHITAIASDPTACVEFYTKVLGLRLVKKSVNQDQVGAYHLFFGDKIGEPGMDVTFFTFPGVSQGNRGIGAVTTISFTVPEKSLQFWEQRFNDFNVKHDGISNYFGKDTLTFYDSDDQRLALVGVAKDALPDSKDVWETTDVTKENAIRCFYSARLSVSNIDLIEPIITSILGFKQAVSETNVSTYAIDNVARASNLEVEENTNQARVYNAAGTVHHIAFQVADEAELEQKRTALLEIGLQPTVVIDRYYFKSVYFRTPAGILFELATNGPGFTIDEPEATLGQKLALPPFLESQREEIEAHLEPIGDVT